MFILKHMVEGFKHYLTRMEKANKEQFGSGKLDCCSLNKNWDKNHDSPKTGGTAHGHSNQKT